jgi:hypothetical protein
MSQGSSTDAIRGRALLAVSLFAIIAVFVFVDPYPQPQAYHAFADTRTLFGIANFWNVATNAVFLVPGIAGLWMLGSGDQPGIIKGLFPAYHILFVGVLLTAFGSGWFHLAPDNNTLFWDRLPMTIAFMSLVAIIVGEHVSENLGRRLLWPLLAIGAASVFYWDYSESQLAGDLRLYGLVQFLPMLLIPAILLMYPSVFDRTRFIWVVFLLYAFAKVFEQMDATLYDFGEVISGHSIKHICAALGPIVLIYGGTKRRLRQTVTEGINHAE